MGEEFLQFLLQGIFPSPGTAGAQLGLFQGWDRSWIGTVGGGGVGFIPEPEENIWIRHWPHLDGVNEWRGPAVPALPRLCPRGVPRVPRVPCDPILSLQGCAGIGDSQKKKKKQP